jgi:glycine/D-amino acid oxidase-like deaminating enzyme
MRTTDVIVIGAGVVGTSVALHALWRGLSVRILERDRVGDGTSARGYGSVALQSVPPELLRIHGAGHAYYPEFVDRIGARAELRVTGSMVLLETPAQIEERRTLHAAQVAAVPGFAPARILDARETRELEPNVAPSIIASSHRSADAHFDPIVMTPRLAQLARDAGAELHEGARVSRMDAADGAWSVTTTVGTFAAAAVVNCAGVWAPEVAAAADLTLSVEAVRGQLLLSMPRPPLCRATINLGSTGLFGSGADLRQRPDGRVLMGTVSQRGSTDLSVRADDTASILRGAARAFPALADVIVERAWAGIRCVPSDGLPYLGACAGAPGQYVAVAHGGLSLGPVMGRAIADLIVSGHTDVPADGLSPERSARGDASVPPAALA